MENMKIFLNFIICARCVLVKIMKYPEKIQILRMIFMKIYLQKWTQADIAPNFRKSEFHESTLLK